jgi:tripartite-type tricarboxylate transporter receptor subunit TctC
MTAFAKAGSDAVQPASPIPFTPRGLTLLGVGCSAVLTWYGVIAPQGMPKHMVARWHAGMKEALTSREIGERFKRDGLEVPEIGSRYFAEAIKRDIAKWTIVFEKGGITL